MNMATTRAATQKDGAVFHQSISNKIKREIYLTFDDGIGEGTEEVVDLLDRKEVSATFFLIGKQLESAYKRDQSMCLRVLKKIYDKHAIGNHSYSHANDFYTMFYRYGGVKIAENKRRSVEDDFDKAKNVILYYLALANGQSDPPVVFTDKYPSAKNQTKGLLRFPGTDTWYIHDSIKSIKCSDRGKFFSLCETDTEEASMKLGKNYNIFGWDCEWKMTDPTALAEKVRASIQEKIDNNTIDYNNLDHINPYFNLYSKEYIALNRPVQSVKEMKNLLLDFAYKSPYPFDNVAKTPGQVVLLMHDREFRKGKLSGSTVDLNDTTHLDKLGKLIDYFIKIDAKFKKLDEY